MVVAIDGPAGAGKSTVAREVARVLGFGYLDSGAMYRSVGLLSLREPGRPPGELAREARIDPGPPVLLDGEDVTEAIRTPSVSAAASRVAGDPEVRDALVSDQRALLRSGNWVAEGRDIGTVVAPGAAVKVFLTASDVERARRRASEQAADPAEVLAAQDRRDARDTQRVHSPLRPAADAVQLDTTDLALDDVVERVIALVRAR